MCDAVCEHVSRFRAMFSKKSPTTSECTQTDSIETQPLRQIQGQSLILLATQRVILSAQESSCSQPELKQGVVDSHALHIAQLKYQLAELQSQRELSARNEAAARQDALCAGLRLWHDEQKGRGELLLEMSNEWQARMLAFHAPSCDQADDCSTEDPQGALTIVESSRTGGAPTGAQLALPESAANHRSPDYARKCLFIDHICHWVATFVRRDWALVCSSTAKAVLQVMYQVYDIWSSSAVLIGQFQSSGMRLPVDNHYLGPADGPLVAAREAVCALRDKAVEAGRDDDPNVRWCSRFVLHMQLTINMYEAMRLQHRQLYYSLQDRTIDLNGVLDTLEQTLEKRDARIASAEDSPDGTVIDDPASHGAEF